MKIRKIKTYNYRSVMRAAWFRYGSLTYRMTDGMTIFLRVTKLEALKQYCSNWWMK